MHPKVQLSIAFHKKNVLHTASFITFDSTKKIKARRSLVDNQTSLTKHMEDALQWHQYSHAAHATNTLTNETVGSWTQIESSGNNEPDHPMFSAGLTNHPHHQVNIVTVWHCNSNPVCASHHADSILVVRYHDLSSNSGSASFYVCFDLLTRSTVVFSKDAYLADEVTISCVDHLRIQSVYRHAGVRDEVEGLIWSSVDFVAQGYFASVFIGNHWDFVEGVPNDGVIASGYVLRSWRSVEGGEKEFTSAVRWVMC